MRWVRPTTGGALFGAHVGSGVRQSLSVAVGGDGALTTDFGSSAVSSPPGLVTPGVWSHVGVLYDAGATRVSLYVNGRLAVQGSAGPLAAAPSVVSLGQAGTGTGRFGGVMDEVSLTQGPLDPGALLAHHAASGARGANATTGVVTRDPGGRLVGVSWSLASGAAVTDTVARSPAGRVVDGAVDGVDVHGGDNYVYDGAGRLVAAWVPGHTLAYGYAATGGCGTSAGAGANTNRTSVTDNGTTTSYCYDMADRLSATTDTTVGSPAYDTHGNTTGVGTGGGAHTLVYDSADRHSTTVNGATTVAYTRDATDRIVGRAATGEATVRYGHTGAGDTAELTLDAHNQVVERLVALPGGVTLTRRRGGTDTWSYPNVHGDTLATADRTGTKQGPTLAYDPYGQALAGIPDNSAGNLDYAWLGRHQRGTEHATSLPVVEMGARPYHPSLGRFLQVDPVQGGSCNNYEYTCADPVNRYDLDGHCIQVWQRRCRGKKSWWRRTGRGVKRAAKWAHHHIGIDANACAVVCVGLTYHRGHLYWSRGVGAIGGAGIGPTYYNTSLNPKRKNRSVAWMLGPANGSFERDDGNSIVLSKHWSAGVSRGMPSLFIGIMDTSRLL